ncbi:hypothetical protein D3C87_1741420 [compost metagenome]
MNWLRYWLNRLALNWSITRVTTRAGAARSADGAVAAGDPACCAMAGRAAPARRASARVGARTRLKIILNTENTTGVQGDYPPSVTAPRQRSGSAQQSPEKAEAQNRENG